MKGGRRKEKEAAQVSGKARGLRGFSKVSDLSEKGGNVWKNRNIKKRGHESKKENAVEVVCIGETMLMFAPQRYELIESSEFFRTYNGGAESNVAIGLERLGVHTSWISKVPNNALGRKIVNEIRGYGVDTSRVIWTEEGRIGLFFVEFGAQPRPFRNCDCGMWNAELRKRFLIPKSEIRIPNSA